VENIEPRAPQIDSVLERLRIGHGLLAQDQFRGALESGEMEVWALPGNCYALMQWGYSMHGRVLNILTTVGTMREAAGAFAAIEKGARAGGADGIMSVGAPGWTKAAMAAGYDVQPRILMTKVLNRDPTTAH
jgi:hypothetical protein